MRIIKPLLIPAFFLCFLAGCETVKGAGKDISSAGNAVTNTAEDASK